jgi:hypothetical protein
MLGWRCSFRIAGKLAYCTDNTMINQSKLQTRTGKGKSLSQGEARANKGQQNASSIKRQSSTHETNTDRMVQQSIRNNQYFYRPATLNHTLPYPNPLKAQRNPTLAIATSR